MGPDSANSRPPVRAVNLSALDDSRLVATLRHLDRHTPAGRANAAKDPVTKMYLQAGLRLLAEQFSAPTTYVDDDSATPFFAWLSRNKIVEETRNEPSGSGLPQHGTLNGIRDRWEPHRNYIADLLLVALASDHWSEQEASRAVLTDDPADADLVAIAHEAAYLEMVNAATPDTTFRIQLIAASVADRDADVRQALVDLYRVATKNWAQVYETVIETYGLTLRPGFSVRDFTHILTATAEGFALRLLAEPDAPVQDHETRTTLLGTTALALLMAGTDLQGDGLSIEEFIRAAMTSE